MKLALLSDIHANLEALDACLAHARKLGVERYAVLGDVVGYGADPGPCVDRVMALAQRGAFVVLGNHDAAAIGGLCEAMTDEAREAIYWTREQLDADQRDFLRALPLSCTHDEVLFVHASAAQPGSWPYVQSEALARACLAQADPRIVVAGHVHEPCLYHTIADGSVRRHRPRAGTAIALTGQRRWLVVLGAVGQPRDGDPAACLALLDTAAGTVSFQRVAYDVAEAARKIRAAGLPERLALRLELGM